MVKKKRRWASLKSRPYLDASGALREPPSYVQAARRKRLSRYFDARELEIWATAPYRLWSGAVKVAIASRIALVEATVRDFGIGWEDAVMLVSSEAQNVTIWDLLQEGS